MGIEPTQNGTSALLTVLKTAEPTRTLPPPYPQNDTNKPYLTGINYAGMPIYCQPISIISSFPKKDFYPSAQVLLSRLCGRFQLYYHFASMEVMYYYPRLMKHCLSL